MSPWMKKINPPRFLPAIGFCLLFFANLVFAQQNALPDISRLHPEKAAAVTALYADSKLRGSDEILQHFLQSQETAPVIVNMKKPVSANAQADLSVSDARKTLAVSVETSQNQVIPQFDRGQMRITNLFTYIFGFSAEVTLQGLEALVNSPDIASVEPDRILYAQLAQGIPLMNATGPRSHYGGTGLSIAVCDTGIDYTHPRLGGGGFPNSKVIGGYDCGDNDSNPMDAQGHGTACAGIAAGDPGTVGDYIGGVAYDARLYAVKISTGNTGSAKTSNMIEGWEWCITHQYDSPSNPILVISTSFGGGRFTSACDGSSPSMTAAAANAVSAGMTLFVSSGNDGYCDAMQWPACITHAISVGAVYDENFGRNPPSGYVGCIATESCVGAPGPPCDEKWYVDYSTAGDQVTTYSNSVYFLDLFAPSNWATTTKTGGGYYTAANGFGGTSASCPYAAGAAAVLQHAAKSITGACLTPAQVRSTLANTGDPITDAKVSLTKPRVNLANAVASLGFSDAGMWLGFSTAWSSASNWSGASIPDSLTSVTIPPFPAGGYFPVVNVGNAVAKDITIKGGVIRIQPAGKLTLSGSAPPPPTSRGDLVFFNSLLCGGFPFIATLTLDGNPLNSTTGNLSACREFDCGKSLNWSLYAETGGCGTLTGNGARAFNCNCLYGAVLTLDASNSVVLIFYESCPGQCSDLAGATAAAGTWEIVETIPLQSDADGIGLSTLQQQ